MRHRTPQAAYPEARAGARYRLDVPEADLYAALDSLRAAEARIISVQPLRPTLEDYFFKLVGGEKTVSHAVEVDTR